MVDLKEAIIHAQQVAEGCGVDSQDCAYQHDKLVDWLEELDAYRAIGPIAHLRELVGAEREGLCLILPSRSIAARYDVADILQDDLKESSFSDPSVGIFGLTWAEGELWQAVIDGLNKGRAEAEAAQKEGGEHDGYQKADNGPI